MMIAADWRAAPWVVLAIVRGEITDSFMTDKMISWHKITFWSVCRIVIGEAM